MTNQKEIMLFQAVHLDKAYQRLLAQATDLEPEYDRILAALPPEDRQLLERYISLGEELEHRKLTLAMNL